MAAIVQIRALKKNYGPKEAVKGLDLDIPTGELFALLGPNGAGKTTTLKMLVGLLRPTSGYVRIGEFNMTTDPIQAKKVLSFVPDVPYVYEKLTAWEFLRFMGKLYNLTPETIETQGEELLKFFSMWEVRDILIEEFSHGMKQKIVLSASLIHNPKVLILDEPMVGLDPVTIHSFKELLRQKARSGMAIIFSTHTLSLAEELADRIGILDSGILIALGSLGELKQKFHSRDNLEHMFMSLVSKEERGKTTDSR
jgi:ABC-2 type transport system ATP-binding protein